MVLLWNAFCQDIFAVIVALIALFLAYFKWSFKYWERRNVPSLETKIPFGNTTNPLNRMDSIGDRFKRYYDQFKARGHKHGGIYFLTKPIYIPIDPEYIKNIMSKDFQHFTDHDAYHNEKDDPLMAHLLNLEGSKWKNLRAKLSPTFSSGKIKIMFESIQVCGENLLEVMHQYESKKEPVDMKEMLARFTTDIIGSCAFGLDCNSFKDPDAEFRKYGKRVFEPTRLESIKNLFTFSFPKLAKALRVVSLNKNVSAFFMKVVKETVEYREKSCVARKDFLQNLIDLKNKQEFEDGYGHDGRSLTMEEVAAQVFVFFLAGFETSSTTMTFCLLELALNLDIQDKVRDEVAAVLGKYGGKLTYDGITEMKYMKMVIDETLRKYPAVPLIGRKCTKRYNVPGTDVILEEGASLIIPIFGLHKDPEYFPVPEKFDPERFNESNRNTRHPFSYLPFGEGPRICIGLRFAVVEIKVGLSMLLKNFKFTLNSKTVTPIKLLPNRLIPTVQGGVWLDVERI